jgi:glycosyltransferase involved in cell wall biosynthesis
LSKKRQNKLWDIGIEMRICLLCVEIFAWGKYGGFGRATRLIGRELVRRGHEVFAVVPRRNDQKPLEILDGITVLSFPPSRPWAAAALLRQADADLYHSQEPSFLTWLARKCLPARKHLVTLRDTRDLEDWLIEFRQPSLSKWQVLSNFLFEDNLLVRKSVRQADAVYCAAHCLAAKARRKYRLARLPALLPTPVFLDETPGKAAIPTICFLARWDRRKRPQLFLKLAASFPDIRFIAVGHSRDQEFDSSLRREYGHLPNLIMPGFVNQFGSGEVADILGKSWILVNTALREGLPNSFIEAASHRCAILSSVDPDGFASRFGWRVENDDFATGLRWLLTDNRWQPLGERGYQYVKETYEGNIAIEKHLACYRSLFEPAPAGAEAVFPEARRAAGQ